MKSYIKIYGPPLLKALKELQKLAIDTPEVCIMDTILQQQQPRFTETEGIMDYFNSIGEITIERCDNIISKSGEMIGDEDFFFEWFVDPSSEQLNDLIEKIDEALAPLGCMYTITTK
ncbi:MAG TPA: hypothetical protein VM050_05665 [Patescibacteria group bacterium]|nr:hypothetical protein [Patescibacteria group bacterium]